MVRMFFGILRKEDSGYLPRIGGYHEDNQGHNYTNDYVNCRVS